MTKEAKPRLGAGDVTIVLGDEYHTLVPSLRASRKICQRYQNLVNAATQAAMGDIECVLVIIAAGLDLTPRGLSDIEDKVFSAGLSDDTGGLSKLCAEYCGILMNGGRRQVERNGEASNDTADPPSSKRTTKST